MRKVVKSQNNDDFKKIIKERNFILKDEEADKAMFAFSVFPSFDIERDLIDKGYETIAGIDEAGRGALAGPLAVGIVIYSRSFILNPDEGIHSINDSKKLSPKKRIHGMEFIKKHAVYSDMMMVSHKIIDTINVNRATEFAIRKILKNLPIKPDVIIMDGKFKFDFNIPCISVIKGDSRSISIASASIMAKVNRDRILEKFDTIYPGFDFKTNKGYGTQKHRDSIKENGFSPIHRKSYEPVKSILSGQKGFEW